ncbi:hypothetical protein R5W24_000544 [Gemmata sp. JC717]|uniref:hypothetical protein n=1 Tax=Gemmata algarum TaxID=2975278 RepID=UPI0021BAE57F|nr:hypothetical protein [Gemmata algarum]MDY3551468.1 hypothetical protein [Gemmata algarum]
MTLNRIPVVGDRLIYTPNIVSEDFPYLKGVSPSLCTVTVLDDRHMGLTFTDGAQGWIAAPRLDDIRCARFVTLSHEDEPDNLGESPPPFRRRLTEAKPPITIHGRRCQVCGKHTHEVTFLDIERLIAESFPGGIRFYVPHDTAMGHRKCLESLPNEPRP